MENPMTLDEFLITAYLVAGTAVCVYVLIKKWK
jgi:hypothetical protein